VPALVRYVRRNYIVTTAGFAWFPRCRLDAAYLASRRMHAFIVTYQLNGTSPCEHFELFEALAPSFAAVPGLLSRMPLENRAAGRYGAFFVFETKGAFDRFVASELYAATDGSPERPVRATSDFSIPVPVTPRRPCAEARAEEEGKTS
jgi:hypothetical protein